MYSKQWSVGEVGTSQAKLTCNTTSVSAICEMCASLNECARCVYVHVVVVVAGISVSCVCVEMVCCDACVIKLPSRTPRRSCVCRVRWCAVLCCGG